MKKTNKISVFLTAALLSQAVFAGPYAAIEAGVNGYGNNNIYENFFETESNGPVGRLSAGYLWDLNNRLGVGLETGFSKYFKDLKVNGRDWWSDSSWNVCYKRWDVDLLGVVDFHATEKFNIFAKAGAAYVNQKISGTIFEQNTTYHLSNSDIDNIVSPKAVIGMGYDVTDNVNLNLSLNHTIDINRDVDLGATAVLAGIKYNFG
jgi:outer membrane immunogenic protein